MTFFLSLLWTLLAFGNTYRPVERPLPHAAAVVHHTQHGGMHVMDTNTGGPT